MCVEGRETISFLIKPKTIIQVVGPSSVTFHINREHVAIWLQMLKSDVKPK